MSLVRAYVGMGANLGDPPITLAWAVARLDGLAGGRVRAVSRLYATKPVGVGDQPDFHNAAVALDIRVADPAEAAIATLEAFKSLEWEAGRRSGRRWGPRELDLDLLVLGRYRVHVEREGVTRSADPSRPGIQWLDVPHPAARERAFVLAPLADLAPGLVPPGWGITVAGALRRRRSVEGPDAVRVVGDWDAAAGAWRPPGVAGQSRGSLGRPNASAPRPRHGSPLSS